MHGKGILYYASGKIAYDGDWVEDKFDGYGLLYNENPVAFTSQFDFRDLDFVEEYWEKYQGEFKDDNKVDIILLEIFFFWFKMFIFK